ncbi:MAG TPA: helix-hairpin-helix domain-containing protein, partial [Anaerolineae bacterium]|nr:helix-hairpin-helix domain-containing protein [Anaerolineae bacterium]
MKGSASVPASLEGNPVKGTYSVRRVTYTNPETGYAVVHLVPADRPSATGLVAVGDFGEPRTGDCYLIEGVWRRDPKHGMQVRVSSVLPETPESLTAIERYLGGASIKGLGPHYAQALVEHFGEGTFAEMQSGGQHLEEVSGIGPVRAQMIRDSWTEHEGIHRLMVDLQGIAGLSPNQAQRVYRSYGRESWQVVSQNPYLLAEQVRGFGFKTCDRIARALGIADDAPQRLQAGVVHLLNEALAEGHLWSPMTALVGEVSTLLGVTPEGIPPQVDALLSQGRVTAEQIREAGTSVSVRALYLPQVARTETRVAERLGYLLRCPPRSQLHLAQDRADRLAATLSLADLTAEQRRAVRGILTGQRLSILTGGPGTGKTTTVRLLIACLEELQVSYALCATTGRASKQLAVLTGRNAATVHRHLRIGVGRDDVETVRESVLIIDESSM